MGWMHREEGIPLETLRLTGDPDAKPLIPVAEIEPAIANFDRLDEYWMARAKAAELVDKLAKSTVERIEKYLEWQSARHQGTSIKTEQAFLDAMTCLAKFAYRDQTNTAKARDFADIPLVARLRITRTNLRKKHPNPWLYHGYQKEDGTWAGLREAMVLCHPRHAERLSAPNARPRIDPKTHNYFFLSTTGKGIHADCLLEIFTGFFKKFAGVPVTPHTLRHIFRTHLKDLEATSNQLESAATWMKHDVRTAEEFYTHQTQEAKLKPAADLMKSLNQS